MQLRAIKQFLYADYFLWPKTILQSIYIAVAQQKHP